MYLRRKIDDYLASWKVDPDRLPLVVRGPRQVGKTESILHFASSSYKNVVTINFVEEPRYKTITSNGYSAENVVKNISLIDPTKRFAPGETLIFFDEIQEFPDMATSLKFFKIDGRFDVICSGSMLGIGYKAIESNSVGYKVDFEMSSLDFEEFLWAQGYDEHTAESMLDHLQSLAPFSKTEEAVYSELFVDYCVLGGMPAVVRSFIEKKSFEGSLALQRQLLADYREDIRKYVSGLDQARVLNVFEHIPVQLAKENKKFQISKVVHGARFKDYWGCIDWLECAGVVSICHCLQSPELPLRGNYEQSKYKLYFRDTGLLLAMIDDEAAGDLRANKNLDIYKGGFYENAIGEALAKQGYDLFYYKRDNSTLEEDFFVRTSDLLVPVEVKARNGTAKSLRTLIGSDKYPDISYGIKVRGGNVGYSNSVLTIPHYCAFLLKRLLSNGNELFEAYAAKA